MKSGISCKLLFLFYLFRAIFIAVDFRNRLLYCMYWFSNVVSNKEDKGKAAIQQQQQENDNTSYSRIDYDGLNESVDEVEEDELEEISTSHRSMSSQAGKPKILTFAGEAN